MDDNIKLCEYGCGLKAKHQLENGKWCCSYSYSVCNGKKVIYPLRQREVERIEKNKNLLKEVDGTYIRPYSDFNYPRSRNILVSCFECGKNRIIRLVDYLKSKTELCSSCWRIGDKNLAKTPSARSKLSMKGVKDISYATEEWKIEHVYGKKNPNYGKKQSEETRKKVRESQIERQKIIKENGGQKTPGYNFKACKIIEDFGIKNGYNFKHAENGGEFYIDELGYWVDGYDQKQNVVVEVDEPYHFECNGELKKKDKIRQEKIQNILKCKFIRIRISEEGDILEWMF